MWSAFLEPDQKIKKSPILGAELYRQLKSWRFFMG
jgi:hypothetical protein